jgi:hypothetical protein
MEEVVFKAWLQYVPLVPLIAAVLLFLLMPFEGARESSGEPVAATAMGSTLFVLVI